jgi:hypothetical protein
MPLPPSASDWTRFQKLRQSLTYENVIQSGIDIVGVVTPAGCTPCSSRAGIRRDQDAIAGSSKTRREASKWIDFIASRQADFITVHQYPGVFGSFGRPLVRTQLCSNNTRCLQSVLPTKVGVLKSAVYQHSRIV